MLTESIYEWFTRVNIMLEQRENKQEIRGEKRVAKIENNN